MRDLLKGAAVALLSISMTGCYVEGESALLLAETTLKSGWRVDCIEAHKTATRECFAAKSGRSSATTPFTVRFLNQEGPFINAGYYASPLHAAVVRIDDLPPRTLTAFDQSIPHQSPRAHIADAEKIVSAMQSGKIATLQYWRSTEGTKETQVDLEGFSEAYRLLLDRVKAQSGVP